MSPCVFVVDDDEVVRGSLCLLLETDGHHVVAFESAEAFLNHYRSDGPACLITDLKMPGRSGLELQSTLATRGVDLPVIMLTGHADVPAAVQSMKYGALDFLQKPYKPEQLLGLVRRALEMAAQRLRDRQHFDDVQDRVRRLTARENEVIRRVGRGQSNKAIAIELGISDRTVELHRARALKKLGVRTVAELAVLITEMDGAG